MAPPPEPAALPDYDDLPEIEGLGVRHAWDVFGRDDVLGSIGLLTDERVATAASLVRTGQRVSLDLPLNLPSPPLFGRQPFDHVTFALSRNEMDDRVDNFHLQGSTQWDGLNHVRCREHGYWGGRLDDPLDAPNGLGVHHWTQHGIAGRGVLVDVGGWLAEQGDFDPLAPRPVEIADLEGAIDAQGVDLRVGDILCLRFGWPAGYRRLDQSARESYATDPHFAGLRAYEDMARWLWNHHPAALCCDNPAVEVVPGEPADGSLHRRLLPTLGFALGEMFDYEELSAICRAEGRWEFFFVAASLHILFALGSPGNAVAIL